MTVLSSAALLYCLAATAIHLATIAITAFRCRVARRYEAMQDDTPPVTIVRTARGLENFVEETLGSSFDIDYPDYEIIFCVAQSDDPVVPVIERMIGMHPEARARLLIGDERSCLNPKLNNLMKGWAAAHYDLILLADSNALIPREGIRRLVAALDPAAGLVCSPPIGARPTNFWGELECCFLNTFQARWQYTSETFGAGFAHGKIMLLRRDMIDAAGGIGALGAEVAEDAAATKIARSAGLEVRLIGQPFQHPLGNRTLRQVWARQARWAWMRRTTFPVYFLPELLAGCVFPLAAAALAAADLGLNVTDVLVGLLAVWLGAEAALARNAGWHLSLRSCGAMLLRDILLPILWVTAWSSNKIMWAGREMRLNSANGGMSSVRAAEIGHDVDF